jgi:hypothetical protein
MSASDKQLAAWAEKAKEAEATAKSAAATASMYKEKILVAMEERGAKSIDSNGWKMTVSAPESTVIDYDGILEALGPVKTRKYQVKVIDKSLLSQAIQAGKVDPEIVAQATSIVPKKPYVTITPSKS